MKKRGLIDYALIWIGAALSLAEIEAGVLCRGQLRAVLLGHAVGFVLLFAMGLIGGATHRNAMQTTAEAFGNRGAKFFAGLNLLQLIGWTAVMMALGAQAAATFFPAIPTFVFCVLIALFAALWRILNLGDSPRVTYLAVIPLGLLLLILAGCLTSLTPLADKPLPVSFSTAFLQSLAMPLSWLPLISDYTRDAQRPVATAAISSLTYTLVSTALFVLGLRLAETVASGLLTDAIKLTGLGTVGIFIVVLSAALSAFFDLYSAGESVRVIEPRLNAKLTGLLVCLIGMILAATGIRAHYTRFLTLIAAALTPMALILIVVHYGCSKSHPLLNAILWLLGFALIIAFE